MTPKRLCALGLLSTCTLFHLQCDFSLAFTPWASRSAVSASVERSLHVIAVGHGGPFTSLPSSLCSQRLSRAARMRCEYRPVRANLNLKRAKPLWLSNDDDGSSDGPDFTEDWTNLFDGHSYHTLDDGYYSDSTTTDTMGEGQSLFVVSMIIAMLLGRPHQSVASRIDFSWSAIQLGALLALPIIILAWFLDLIGERFPELKDVTLATQRRSLTLLGSEFKPGFALPVSIATGVAVGFLEEILYRGIMQYDLSVRLGPIFAVGVSSIVFGLLHAVTPHYAILAGLASVYFGAVYVWFDNLAVPMTSHALFDVVSLMVAHWTVSRLTPEERDAVANWEGPGSNENELL